MSIQTSKYRLADEIAEELVNLEENGVLSRKDIAGRPQKVFEKAKEKDAFSSLYRQYDTLRYVFLREELDKALEESTELFKAGDVYLVGDVEEIDERACDLILQAYRCTV